MDLDDGVTLRAADDPRIKNELRRAWIADRLDERLGEFGQTHDVEVVCATWNANGKDVKELARDRAVERHVIAGRDCCTKTDGARRGRQRAAPQRRERRPE